jgi:hypothetical protein
MKIIATERPYERNRSCSSIPVMAGIWTSTIRQDVPVSCGEARKSLAEANVRDQSERPNQPASRHPNRIIIIGD